MADAQTGEVMTTSHVYGTVHLAIGVQTVSMDDDALTWSEVRDLVDVGRSSDVSGLIDRLVEYRDRVGDRWEMDPAR